jgi:hypothetical protein
LYEVTALSMMYKMSLLPSPVYATGRLPMLSLFCRSTLPSLRRSSLVPASLVYSLMVCLVLSKMRALSVRLRGSVSMSTSAAAGAEAAPQHSKQHMCCVSLQVPAVAP